MAPRAPADLPDIAAETELADSVSTAMLVVLETLSPVERAVFLLREVFGYSHAEIAETLERPEPTVRQIAHRAREHVRARRPRFDADQTQRRQVTAQFIQACAGGDLNAVMELLAPDVTAWSDGGGKVTAARRPLQGTDHVARWLVGFLAKPELAALTMEPASSSTVSSASWPPWADTQSALSRSTWSTAASRTCASRSTPKSSAA